MKKLDNLTDRLSQKTSVTQYKKDSNRTPPSIQEIIFIIRTNKFDWSNRHHVKKLNTAIKYGYIDEDLNILKEV